MSRVKEFLKGFCFGFLLGVFPFAALLFFIPLLKKNEQGQHQPEEPIIIYNLEDNRTIQFFISSEPRQLNRCVIASSVNSSGESDFN